MVTPIVSSQDGPRLTVAQLMKSPTLIPRRILRMLDQEFMVDAILRQADDAPSGTVVYYESTPLYAPAQPAVIEEFGEIPTVNGTMGTPRQMHTVRRALGMRVSLTMIRRNSRDLIDTQMTQIHNTMIRAWEDAFYSALVNNSQVQTMTTDTVWSSSSSHIRKDVNAAKFLITNASSNGNGQNGSDKFGYTPNTLVVSEVTATDLLDSNEFNSVFQGNIADQNLRYTGKLPKKFQDLDVVRSWRLDSYAFGAAIVLERKTVGGISDERPLEATPMYGEGNGPNGGKTESWRSDITRQSAVFIDQPKCAVVIHGVHA